MWGYTACTGSWNSRQRLRETRRHFRRRLLAVNAAAGSTENCLRSEARTVRRLLDEARI